MKAKFLIEFDDGQSAEVTAKNGQEAVRSVVGQEPNIQYMRFDLGYLAALYLVYGADTSQTVKVKYVTSAIKGQS